MSEINIIKKNNNLVGGCHELAHVDGLNLFMSHGRAWHGLGWETDQTFTKQDIEDIFPDLLYRIEHRPCFADVGGNRIQITDVNAIVMVMNGFEKFFEARSATNDRPIIQPAETLEMLETAFAKFGAKFSSVGALYGGETFFVSAELPTGFQVAGDDHLSYLNATDNFTGQQRFKLFSSDFRIVCRNTARAAWAEATKSWSTNHSGDMKSRIAEVITEFESIIAARPKAIELLTRSAKVNIAPEVFVDRVLDSVTGVLGLGVAVTKAETLNTELATMQRFPKLEGEQFAKAHNLLIKQARKRQDVFDDIMERYASSNCDTARGSVYSAYQAVTEYANYGMSTRETANKMSNQFMSLADGKASKLTDAAWDIMTSCC